MGVLKEWRCAAHGNFESSEESPECPHGCDTVERVFLTPVGFRSPRTANIDSTVEGLARRHGLSDISNRGGRAAVRENPNARRQQEELSAYLRDRYGDGWKSLPAGATYNARTGQVEKVEGRSGNGAMAALNEHHAPTASVVSELKEAGAFVPKPVLVRKDHENLKVDVSMAPTGKRAQA